MGKILPTKLIPERITVKFNFADELEWGETLTLALSELEVVSGEDPTPNFILRLQPVINGDEVSQQLRLGTAGVLYRLTIEATTSAGRTISKDANLAILPSDATSPLPFGINYSTSLYPIEVREAFDATGMTLPFVEIYTPPSDLFNASQFIVIGAALSNGFNFFTAPTEAFDAVSFTLLSGTLVVIFVQFTAPVEAFDAVNMFPLSGTLVVILITYANWPPEGFDASTFVPLSGTLV